MDSAGLGILLGHGSGSFGHPVADRFRTREGASTPEEWSGFTQVWHTANKLNRIVIDALRSAGLPAVSLPPSASAISSGGEIEKLSLNPIRMALDNGLLPVIQGDVSFDLVTGSTILSTEMVFRYLAPLLKPDVVLLAGIEPGVYPQYPPEGEVLSTITSLEVANLNLGPSTSTDVTGGMANKVAEAISISKAVPGLSVRIFSGEEPNAVLAALQGAKVGTLVTHTEFHSE
jgi:isopentenyl phosphate kinase